jgi:hypothetical protein
LGDGGGSSRNGDLVGLLDGGAVGLGVGVGNAEFDEGGSGGLEG